MSTRSSSVTWRLQISPQQVKCTSVLYHSSSCGLCFRPLGTRILQKTFLSWCCLLTCCLPGWPVLSPVCILTQSFASSLVSKRDWRLSWSSASCPGSSVTQLVPELCPAPAQQEAWRPQVGLLCLSTYISGVSLPALGYLLDSTCRASLTCSWRGNKMNEIKRKKINNLCTGFWTISFPR